jgi:hypothetical protein
LEIPAAEAEIGAWTDYKANWMPLSNKKAMEIVEENIPWLEHTYNKIGNQISIKAMGY